MVTTRNGTMRKKNRTLTTKPKKTKKITLSEKFGIGLGKYVSGVEFSQVPTIFNDDTSITATDANNDLSDTEMHQKNSYAEEDVLECSDKLCNDDPSTKDNNISKPIEKGAEKKKAWKDFRLMHQKYKENWRQYPPSEETRPMRLVEFIWAHSDPPKGPYEYDLDDKVDRTIYELDQPTQSCKEFLAEHYRKEELAKKNDIPSDASSIQSELSAQSMLSFTSSNTFPMCTKPNSTVLNDTPTQLHSLQTIVLDDSSDSDDNVGDQPTIAINRNVNIVLTSKTHNLHIPDFYHAMYHSNNNDCEKEQLLKSQNWVTNSLLEEMSEYYPKQGDIIKDPLTNDQSYNKASFAINFNKMFPQDRIFLNYLQLREAVKVFFKHWNLVSKGISSTLRCSYSHIARMKTNPCTPKRMIRKSIASQVKCPFEIKWSLLEHKKPYRNDIFYKAKISNVKCLHHTCLMSAMSYVVAVKSTKGHHKLDLGCVKTDVDVLKINPSLSTAMLRPLLKSCVPLNTNLSSKYVTNFKRRVALYHVKSNVNGPITMEDAKCLTSTLDLAQSEYVGITDPLIHTNLSKMYAKIMQEDNNTWSAISFLKTCKATIPGFDYRVLYSKVGIPTALLYMTSRMRYNLLRYGNILFLDGQKRRFNKLNWPYIGPVIKNSDNRIGVTCESIVTTEDIDTYTWILKAMLSIEPRWSFTKIQLIYADGLVTKRLLQNLSIEHSCVLHGDFYHLMKENWPKPHNFGIVVFRLIKSFLAAMLTSATEEEWDSAYQSAYELITEHPSKVDLLNKIYNNPQYYAGYVTKQIVGNLNLNGSVPAEQNHSSNVRFIGDVMLNSVCEHIKTLLERQQQLCNKETDLETDYIVRSHRYLPQLEGDLALEDIKARQVLSLKPHKEYFILQLKATEYLQSTFDTDDMKHNVWPANEPFDNNDKNHVSFSVGTRCPCWRRIDFNVQCKHELKINPKFKKHHWGHRWYNRKEYNLQFPSHCDFTTNNEIISVDDNDDAYHCTTNNEQSMIPLDSAAGNSSDVINVDNEYKDNTVRNSIIDNVNSNVTYKDVLEIATDLCRTVSDHPTLCKSTYKSLHEWIAKLRAGDGFNVVFNNTMLPTDKAIGPTRHPHPAIVSPPLQGRKLQKRMKSSQEYQRHLFTSTVDNTVQRPS